MIDDTPETVVLSSFDPVRRETARVALENLIADGRIHPARIEEMYHKAADLVQQRVREAGEQAAFDTGIHDLHPEIVKTLGALRYRTSFGQNVLQHSLEVSDLCGVMASELGLDVVTAKRAGLLHDLGKAIDHDVEGPHAVIGAELARRYGGSPLSSTLSRLTMPMSTLTRCSTSWYRLPMPSPPLAPVPVASLPRTTSSALRSSRRSPTPMTASSVPYAMQAGREVHVMVQLDKISDAQSTVLAHDIAHQIEEEMEYPGQVRVVVIRGAALSISLNNMSDANELISFIASMSGRGNLRVEENLGEGYVRLRVSEAERRQAKHDIQHVEDIVIEMLRNARDAGADKVYLATTKEDGVRTLVFLDNGSGVSQDMQERIFDARVTSKLRA